MEIYENFNTRYAQYVYDIDSTIMLCGKEYTVEGQLGGGGQSFVLKISEIIEDDQGKDFAIKICKIRNKFKKSSQEYIPNNRFNEEVTIAKEFSATDYRNNFITYLFDGTITLKHTKKASSELSNHSYYVMDLASESLEYYLCNKFKFTSEMTIYPVIKELVRTIKILHEKDYVHRDIKPQNILIHGDILKLADFGMVERENTTCEKHGPKYWPTPELLEMCDDTVHCSGKKTDVFMLGCILYFIYTKKYPVGNIDINLIDNDFKMKPIIEKMIAYKQEDRFNCAKEVYDEIIKLSFD